MNRQIKLVNKCLKSNYYLVKREYGIRNYKIFEELRNYSLEFTLMPPKIHLKYKNNDKPLGRWNTINMDDKEKLNIAATQSSVHCGPCGTENIDDDKINKDEKK